MENKMKLSFEKRKENTQGVQFRIDPITNKKLTAIKHYYSKEANRKVTVVEIFKQLVQQHYEVIKND